MRLRRWTGTVLVAIAIAAGAAITLHNGPQMLARTRMQVRLYHGDTSTPLWHSSIMGSRASVIGITSPHGRFVNLVLNGFQAMTFAPGGGGAVAKEVGIAPAFFSRHLGRALVVGAGIGTTADGTASVYRDVTVVDLDPNMDALLKAFSHANDHLLGRQNVHVIQDDALSMLLASRRKFDAIVITSSLPSYHGANQVYTRAFFATAKAHLRPGGVLTVWFDPRFRRRGIEEVVATLRNVFPHIGYFDYVARYGAFVASSDPIAVARTRRQVASHVSIPDVILALNNRANHDWTAGLASFLLRPHVFPVYGPTSGVTNTLNRPSLQYMTDILRQPTLSVGRLSHHIERADCGDAIHMDSMWLLPGPIFLPGRPSYAVLPASTRGAPSFAGCTLAGTG